MEFDRDYLIEKLQAVLEGKEETVNVSMYTPSDIHEVLKCEWDINQVDLETNGYQVDFWITYKYKDKTYTHAGCWYYGGATFSLMGE